ncbi:LytTR family DNA-binding domain-containing protein [Ammoniphilus sp. CFH 90114]|uniref:LytR/AlgR family response regulator transcription factor n=1 Tax=Ammoniphilus sp. CFH 90114 TaxID=2493665 RepID=UPI00101001DA|nr:LytTR family DNA-binding domain-containing protein [Ammoniphilus sp. CFH 90114]RXT03830.1 response regulator transcription factor [Ammoniphilus sp. CFH 90114]
MDELKIVIADDDELSRRIVRRFLETIPNTTLVGEVTNGEELMEQVLVEEPNLVLLDITMPKLSGLDAIRECLKVLPQLKMIFITGHDQYAAEAFNLSAVDYVVKPVERQRLFVAIEKARQLIKAQQEDRWKEFYNRNDIIKKLIIRSERSIYFVPMKEVLFIEKIGRKSWIHTHLRMYESNETLGTLFKRLDSTFFQSHRSFLINLEHIHSIKPSGETYMVHFQDYEKPAFISKSKMNLMLEFIEQHAQLPRED